MTILASEIIGKAKLLIQDLDAERWGDPEWLGWMNDGRREVVSIRPTALTKLSQVKLATGVRQSIPADGSTFIDAPGLRRVSIRLMDAQTPTWRAATQQKAAKAFLFDPAEPTVFLVSPPSDGTQTIDVRHSAVPQPITASDPIGLDDLYANPLLDYLLYRAYLKESEFIGNAEKALLYRKAFEAGMGLRAAPQ